MEETKINIKGTKVIEQEVEITPTELLNKLELYLGTRKLHYYPEKEVVGYYTDVSSDRSNFEDWQLVVVGRLPETIELVKAMEVIRERVK